MTRNLLLCALLFSLPTWGLALRYPQADLHGFPSMSDQSGKLIADGELTQKLEGRQARRARGVAFQGRPHRHRGRPAAPQARARPGQLPLVERAARRTSGTSRSISHRQGDRDAFQPGQAETWSEKLDLPAGKAFTGYSTALAVAQLRDGLQDKDAPSRVDVRRLHPKPRTVSLEISRQQGAQIRAAGRELAADLFTLHPKIPFPVSLFAGAKDATSGSPTRCRPRCCAPSRTWWRRTTRSSSST